MISTPRTEDLVVVVSPVAAADPGAGVVAAAAGAGGRGVLDLAGGDFLALRALGDAARRSVAPVGVRVPAGCAATPAEVDAAAGGRVELVVLAAGSPWPVAEVAPGRRVLAEVTDLAGAHRAQAAGAHGLIARGSEAGPGHFSSFVLLQHLLGDDGLHLPVWAAGGIGPRTAVACLAGGAAGVVLDDQLALMPEADLPDEVSAAIRRMDGTETVLSNGVRGLQLGTTRKDRPGTTGKDPERPRTDGYRPGEWLPIGQDAALAAAFAGRWRDTAAAVRGIIAELAAGAADDSAARALAPGAPLAAGLGLGVPVAQGPMTRVSDQPAFAAAVAAEGALPFVALALADGPQTARLLDETAAALDRRPWGVGVLGFAPDEVREQQIEAIRPARRTRSSPAADRRRRGCWTRPA
jgi:NAD(P)H-dependent flavin oxidoreductase YrpB (nitropropane dioxygenase family)